MPPDSKDPSLTVHVKGFDGFHVTISNSDFQSQASHANDPPLSPVGGVVGQATRPQVLITHPCPAPTPTVHPCHIPSACNRSANDPYNCKNSRSSCNISNTTCLNPNKFVSVYCLWAWLDPPLKIMQYTWGDSDVISMPAGFHCHLVGNTFRNNFHCDIAEICFAGNLVIIDIFINQRIECYLNNTINLCPSTSHIMPIYTNKIVIVATDSVTSLHPVYWVLYYLQNDQSTRK